MNDQQPRWRKSSYSGADNQCIDLAYVGLVRDSKNPEGPRLRIGLSSLLAAIKDDRL
jgi:hypothetical protein